MSISSSSLSARFFSEKNRRLVRRKSFRKKKKMSRKKLSSKAGSLKVGSTDCETLPAHLPSLLEPLLARLHHRQSRMSAHVVADPRSTLWLQLMYWSQGPCSTYLAKTQEPLRPSPTPLAHYRLIHIHQRKKIKHMSYTFLPPTS